MTKRQPIFLDDLSVGDEFASGEHSIDAEQIVSFASQFDPQSFHLDAEAAKSTFFKGLAASGWHTAAITMKLIVQSFPVGTGVIGLGGEIEWPRPTRPGETLRVVSKVLGIAPSRSKPDRGIVTVECQTLNERDEICQRLVTKLLVMRRRDES